ncbi:nuclear transport factor 2 family protein [Pedobacter sp. PF22-3]|uniref:nuclear transport factor 2 family protein n=1 Tax=Pedobacter sp. PF22-3 TaxID=2994467 RepID=UPI002247A80A|nr:nuclear transport factor 2 family protein [Pedobacter sp. PF22-3]MCX2492851.1 nuclear transport factor 2 family protein [Pedobacter sp. PF22-3]
MDYIEQELINRYKYLWEQHDVQNLGKLFTQDIVYHEKSTVKFVGLEELEVYWTENKNKQENVKFNVLRYVSIENQIIIDWRASFYDNIKKIALNLDGIMWWDLRDGKISTLKEFFNIN